MPMLGPHVPAWNALRKELDILVHETGAIRAAIVDEANILWCWSSPSTVAAANKADENKDAEEGDDDDNKTVERLAGLFHEAELSEQSLRRGRHLSVLRREEDTSYVAESFAGVYVLVLWCHALFPALSTQAAVASALPKIEALTIALPRSPDDGSGLETTAKAKAGGKLRA